MKIKYQQKYRLINSLRSKTVFVPKLAIVSSATSHGTLQHLVLHRLVTKGLSAKDI